MGEGRGEGRFSTDRLLVMRGGALGDFVLGLPGLGALRDAFPRATLELIAPAAVLPLARPLADVTTPLEWAGIAALFADAKQLSPEVVERYQGLDLVVLWLADADGAVRRNFARLGARRVLHAPALPTEPGLHAADHLLNTLRPLGIGEDATTKARRHEGTKIVVSSCLCGDLDAWVAASPVSLVAIHPGSGGDWKRWAPERFAEVADGLDAAGLRVALIRGPADEEAVAQVLGAVRREAPPVVADLGIEELADFLSRCTCYLGNDSGVTHLAAALGVPTVAIFGPTDTAKWGPRGPHVAVLRAERDCAPCSRDAAVACRDRTCLDGVEVERVLGAVLGMVAGPSIRSANPPERKL